MPNHGLLATLLVLLAAPGCGGGGSEPSGSISISVSPATVTVAPGGAGTVTVSLTRSGGFAGPVSLTVSGLSAGVTSAVSPAQLPPTSTQAQITVTVGNTVAAGTHSLTVTASGTGVASATASYSLTISQPPDYSLAVTPTTVAISPGQSGTATVQISRQSFPGAVTLAVVNNFTGITGQFTPAVPTGESATLTVNVGTNVIPGTFGLGITGAASGLPQRTATLIVTVVPPVGYSIFVGPNFQAMDAGTTASRVIVLTRTRMQEPVFLTLRNPPPGFTGSFVPSTVVGSESILALSTTSSVLPGTYALTVAGTAAGVPEQSRQFSVIVPPTPETAAPTTYLLAAAMNANVSAPPGGVAYNRVVAQGDGTDDVTLSLVSPPVGITGAFTPSVLKRQDENAMLQLNIAPNVPPGSYQIQVQARAGGVTSTDQFTLGVHTESAFSLAAVPALATVARGRAHVGLVSIIRTNFTGDVLLQVENVPAGIRVSPMPVQSGQNNAVDLIIDVTAGAPIGTHTLTIRGSSPGQATQTTTFLLTVSG
jgi:hypothetical protein